ncbi:MAG: hypothetical protein NTZ05_19340, partial [Chloroflexi bacterium]|nr:hypothetical protein [Chloroflexota bacterium]
IVSELQQEILTYVPEAKFGLSRGSQEQFLNFSVYTPTGNMAIPADIMARLDDIYRTHKTYVITVVYTLGMYQSENEDA